MDHHIPPVARGSPVTLHHQINARLGGAAESVPFRIFSIAQKWRQISTRNSQYLIQHQLASFIKICGENFENFLREWNLVSSCFTLRGKKGKCFKTSRMCSFEVKHNRKTSKSLKYIVIYTTILDFRSQFFKNHCLQNKKSSIYIKT